MLSREQKWPRENVNNLKKCARGIVLILGLRLFSVERKLVLVNSYRLLLNILNRDFSMKFKYFNMLDGSFSAVNICVLTPLRALTR